MIELVIKGQTFMTLMSFLGFMAMVFFVLRPSSKQDYEERGNLAADGLFKHNSEPDNEKPRNATTKH